jgi:hypothetical protein
MAHRAVEKTSKLALRVKGDTVTIRRAKARKKWTEKELLKGVTPTICGPDLIPDRKGQELL